MAQAAARLSSEPAGVKAHHAPSSYRGIYEAEPLERIGMIKSGVRAASSNASSAKLSIPQAMGLAALDLPAATVNRKASQDSVLARDEGER